MYQVSTLLLLYTALVLFLYAAATLLSMALYVVTKRRITLAHAGVFAGYVVELVTVLAMEWDAQNRREWFSAYAIDAPVLKVIEGLLVLGCLWASLLYLLDLHSRRLLMLPLCAMALAQIAVAGAMTPSRLAMWAFYSVRQAFMLGCLGYVLVCFRRSTDETYRMRLARHAHTYVIATLLVLAVLVEDSLVILLLSPPSETSGSLSAFLFSRNVCENALMAYLAILCIHDAVHALRLRFEQPPMAADGVDLSASVADRLSTFAAAHGLSKREAEVMSLVAGGAGNRAIAQELYLSEGTVRTHVHNIMKKVGVNRREELAKRFWST